MDVKDDDDDDDRARARSARDNRRSRMDDDRDRVPNKELEYGERDDGYTPRRERASRQGAGGTRNSDRDSDRSRDGDDHRVRNGGRHNSEGTTARLHDHIRRGGGSGKQRRDDDTYEVS